MDLGLKGRWALVCAASKGLGRGCAEALADEGVNVVITARGEADLLATAAALRVLNPAVEVRTVAGDIATEAGRAAALAACPQVDILVNNAGGQFPSPAQHITPNGFLAVVKNNLVGTFNMTREVANRSMIAKKSGRIVNVIANIYRGFPGMAHTGAARAGVENLTMTLAVEWAQFGILVNAVAPGIIISSGTAQYPPQLLERGIAETPLKRAGTIDEVAASILFLASPAAQFITGTTLRIDGGQALWGHTWEIP
jgi:citronellol/citronellal dehydrogenase